MKHRALQNRVYIHANSRLEQSLGINLRRTRTWGEPETESSEPSDEGVGEVLVVGNSVIE